MGRSTLVRGRCLVCMLNVVTLCWLRTVRAMVGVQGTRKDRCDSMLNASEADVPVGKTA